MTSQIQSEYRDSNERHGLDASPTSSAPECSGEQSEFAHGNNSTTHKADEDTRRRTTERMASRMQRDKIQEGFNEELEYVGEPFENMSQAGVRKDMSDISARRAEANQGEDGNQESFHAEGSDEQPSIVPTRPCENLLPSSVIAGAAKSASPQAGATESEDGMEESIQDNKDNDPAIRLTSPSREISIQDMSPNLAAFERRAGSATPRSAHNQNLKSPHYTDLAEADPPNAHEQRLQAMRARNAEENHHHRIPPEEAPRHMQVMVIIYQWAAWAKEISNEKRREEMTQWVNGRFLDFVMMGGHVPGYNLKELLQLAGVDPKELYGFRSDPADQRPMADMSSSQLAAAITGSQPYQTRTDYDAEGTVESGAEFDQDDTAVDLAMEDQPTGIGSLDAIENDEDDGNGEKAGKKDGIQLDDSLIDISYIFGEDDSSNHHDLATSEASKHRHGSPLTTTRLGKRATASDVESSPQVYLFSILHIRAMSSNSTISGC
jgi:hypothetical protein